ncbi:MAG: DUF5946 family protein [Candidatus Limnocylindrales bacterium]
MSDRDADGSDAPSFVVMAISVCPGCGLRAPPGGIPLDRPLNASPECWGLHAELVGFELNHPVLVGRYHQLTVDAYGAQHAGGPTGRIRVAYSLVGLHLALEQGRSGAAVCALHQRMGRADASWPDFRRPHSTGALTVADVVEAGARIGSVEGHAASVERWARSVWDAWADQQDLVRGLTARLLDEEPAGPILVVRYAGRGTVTWTPGRLTYAGQPGDRLAELGPAIEALMEIEQVDLASGLAVRAALLTVAGARIVRESLGPSGGMRTPNRLDRIT